MQDALKSAFASGEKVYQRNQKYLEKSIITELAYESMISFFCAESFQNAKQYGYTSIVKYTPAKTLDADVEYAYILDFDHNKFYAYKTKGVKRKDSENYSPWLQEGDKGYEPMLPWYAQMCAYSKKKNLMTDGMDLKEAQEA